MSLFSFSPGNLPAITPKRIVSVNLDTFSPEPSINGKGTHGGYCGPAVKPIALNLVSQIARDPETQNKDICDYILTKNHNVDKIAHMLISNEINEKSKVFISTKNSELDFKIKI